MGLCRDCMVYPKFRSRRLESRSQKLLFSYSRRYDRSPFWRIGRIRHPLSVNSGICPLTHLSRFMRGIPCDSWGKPSRCAVLMRRSSEFMRRIPCDSWGKPSRYAVLMRRSSEFMRRIPRDSWGKPSRYAVLMRRNSDFMRRSSEFMRHSSEFMRHKFRAQGAALH